MRKKYEAAQKLLTQHTRTAVLNGRPSIHWSDGIRFSYEKEKYTGVVKADGTREIETVMVHVDTETGEEWTEEVSAEREKEIYEQETGRKIQKKVSDRTFSPDGFFVLYNDHYNLMLEDTKSGEVTALTSDGEPRLEYGSYVDIYSQITVQREGYVEHPLVCWSPDGTQFVITRADRRSCKTLYLLESFADDVSELRPALREYPCPFVTDTDEEIPHYSLYVGNIKDKTLKKVDAPDFLYPLFTSPDRSFIRWLSDSSGFYFTWIGRGFKEGCMYLADAKDGSVKLLVRETTDTFLNLGAFGLLDGYGTYLFSNFVTTDRKYAFWWSERSGYAHFYRYDLTNPKDKGVDLFSEENEKLIVQKIIRVEEETETIYFMANNVAECSDPLYYQCYKVRFDGTDLKRLTPEDSTHTISMGEKAFVDTYSTVDTPPVTVLRNKDGEFLQELVRADVSPLLKAGYQLPKRFKVTCEDGKTELYGILVPPVDLDMEKAADDGKTYPVIDYIYGGSQLYNVPREFTWDNGMNREIMGGLQEFAQLGFAGIILDGRGTPGRGMKFHGHAYHNIHGCAGLDDHVTCAKQLKEQFPFLDMDRIGIWGNSGGGYATVSAMFKYPDFYKVGVASSGNYDQRMYEHSWTERYNGLYDEDVYKDGDITRLAENLEGKLMLAYGAMDDNVAMSQTLRLCDELNRYNKDYELVVLPRMNHNVPSDLYFIRRKMDFFVKHLLEEEPPKEFRFDVM